MEDVVKTLLEKAANTDDSAEAMRFSQAAANAAHAIGSLADAKRLGTS